VLYRVLLFVIVLLFGYGCFQAAPSIAVDNAGGKREARAVLKVWSRASEELSQIPGVVRVEPGPGVIYVFTDNPTAAPSGFEGTPINVLPATATNLGRLPR